MRFRPARSLQARDNVSGPPNRPVDHVQVTRNGCYRQRLIHGTPLVGRLRRGSPEAARAGGPVLYDVTLLNLSHVVYSYPSTIKDLMLNEHE